MGLIRAAAAIIVTLVLLSLTGARAAEGDPTLDCMSEDNDRRISGCSALLDMPGLEPEQRSLAYGLRALAYSLKGNFTTALADYDKAIELNPGFAAAFNNRAWAYYKLGRSTEGTVDVEKALKLSPGSPYALDTRAHIRQSQGDSDAALTDYQQAMRNGGERIVKLYQCGLRSQGLYFGSIDGLSSGALTRAMQACATNRSCDPLPADEDCRPSVS